MESTNLLQLKSSVAPKMSSVSSGAMAHSAPPANSTGSSNAHYADYADEPLPPKGQQSQSWFQSTVNVFRGIWKPQSPMPADPYARLAKAKKLAETRSWTDYVRPYAQSDRIQEAINIYKDVAREFLDAEDKKPVEAGDAFQAAALLELNEVTNNDASITGGIEFFNSAHLAYYDVRPLESVKCLQQIIKLWMKNGNYHAAAQKSDKLGDLYMEKCHDPENAIKAWQKSGEWHRNDRNMATAVRVYSKLGEAYAKKGDYYKAIETWEWCADNYPEGNIKSSQTLGFFLNAGVCHVATGDTVAISRAIQHYVDRDNSFGGTNEYRFLSEILNAMENGDEQRYKYLKEHFTGLPKFTGWKKALLDTGLQKMSEAGDDFS